MGQGAIVTIWGNNLGSSQGSSKVYFKDSNNQIHEVAHIYYWKNADGQLPGGPSDLYTYHKMQEIAFSIPSASTDGAGKIYVEANGVKSSELNFTIRSGNIYFVKNGGNNSTGDGSWNNPWATLDYYDSPAGASRKVNAGDIVYIYNVTESTDAVDFRDNIGTLANPTSFITYPGATYQILNSHINLYMYGEYIIFSKIHIESNGTGVECFEGMRAVGCEVTDYPDGAGCANGSGGGFSGKANGILLLGNYIHDFGCSTTSNLHHALYLTNRTRSCVYGDTDGLRYVAKIEHISNLDNRPTTGSNWAIYWEIWPSGCQTTSTWAESHAYTRGTFSPFEVGWNYLYHNEARQGIHVYDEHEKGGWSGTSSVHNNVVVDQSQFGIDLSLGDTGDVVAYNNLLLNCGLISVSGNSAAVKVDGAATGHFDFYNNTVYGWPSDHSSVYVGDNFGGSLDWINNIAVDTNNSTSFAEAGIIPTIHSNNLWYNGGDGNPASPPSWDTNPITSNPLFVNPASNNFTLQSTSPAINTGSSLVSSVATKDFLGLSRPQGSGYDIGAFEYDENTPADDAVAPSAPWGLSVR